MVEEWSGDRHSLETGWWVSAWRVGPIPFHATCILFLHTVGKIAISFPLPSPKGGVGKTSAERLASTPIVTRVPVSMRTEMKVSGKTHREMEFG